MEAAEQVIADSGAHPADGLPRVLGDSPVAVLLVDRESGQVTFANAAALELAGAVRLPVAIDRWAEAAGVTDLDGAPLAATAEPLSRVAAGEPVSGEPVRIGGTAESARADGRADGELGPVVWATGFPLGPGAGDPALSLLVFLPVEQPAAGADPEQLLQALRNRAVLATDICFAISDPRRPDNPLVWVNPAFTRVTGYAAEDAIGHNCRFLQGPATDPAAVAQLSADLAAERSSEVTLLNYRADGTAFWNHLSVSPVRDGEGQLVAFVGVQSDVTVRMAADADRDAALAAERTAREAAEAAQEAAEAAQAGAEAARARLALLAGATTELTGSLDVEELQQRLARLSVPLLGDWVFLAGVDDDGSVSSLVVEHRDGDAVAGHVADVRRQYLGRPLPADLPIAVAMTTGQPVTVDELTPDQLRRFGRGLAPGAADALGMGSLLAMPLTSATRTWGALLLGRRQPHGFTADDLDVVRDLGRRAGQALDNARSYTREASVAEALQHALLPEIPEIPDVDAAAHYTAATATSAVGGDFYDLLTLPGGAVGIVIGDVVGHDITAASAMGQLRGLIRSEAWGLDAPGPEVVLTRVDRLLDVLQLPVLATAALLRATRPEEPGGDWPVDCGNAGHPPVLLRTPAGEVETFCDDHGLLLGTGFTPTPRTTTTRTLPAGTQLVLYTDGLVEQPLPGSGERDIDAGIERLTGLLRSLPAELDADGVCRAIDGMVVEHLDDIAVLVIQLGTRPADAAIHPGDERDHDHMTPPRPADDVPDLAQIDTGSMTVADGTLTLVGDIDYALVTAWQAVNPGPHQVSAVDAAQVTFLGSAGIAFLLRLAAAAPERLVLRSPSRPARRPLEVMGADALMDITP
ncbi:PAS domain S-box-containing protein [Klenkia marina]|uniref:PAS domain S-box-containing protein n=1 Tax=Klenkia marina TaxID=1960309 RepID=A0A1G4XQB1_9ACTN|nr:PAS domain S-box-containing protein [Klenkia marina]